MTKIVKYTCDLCGKEIKWWYSLIIKSNYAGLHSGKVKYLCGDCFKKIGLG